MSAAGDVNDTSAPAAESGAVRASFSHVGISVDDLDAALAWYEQLLGFTTRTPPAKVEHGTPQGAMMADMLGPRFGKIRYAIMSTTDGLHVEVFEPEEPALTRPDTPLEFWRAGPWHIAVTVPDVAATAATIAATGGQVLSEVHSLVPDQPYRICMCVDPFGVAIELYSHDLSEILASLSG